jgi:hypothetical protein
MSPQEIVFEIQRGGKFVRYQWCVSAPDYYVQAVF